MLKTLASDYSNEPDEGEILDPVLERSLHTDDDEPQPNPFLGNEEYFSYEGDAFDDDQNKANKILSRGKRDVTEQRHPYQNPNNYQGKEESWNYSKYIYFYFMLSIIFGFFYLMCYTYATDKQYFDGLRDEKHKIVQVNLEDDFFEGNGQSPWLAQAPTKEHKAQ